MLSGPKDDDRPTRQSSPSAKNCPLCKTYLSKPGLPLCTPHQSTLELCASAATYLDDLAAPHKDLSLPQSRLCERAEDKSHAAHAMLVKTRSAFAPNMIHQCWLSKRARSREGVNLRVVWVGLGCRSCTSDPREFASDRYRRKIWTLGTQYLTQIWPKVAISIWTESDDTQWPLLLLLLLYKGIESGRP